MDTIVTNETAFRHLYPGTWDYLDLWLTEIGIDTSRFELTSGIYCPEDATYSIFLVNLEKPSVWLNISIRSHSKGLEIAHTNLVVDSYE